MQKKRTLLWRKTDSQSNRRRAVLFFKKGDCDAAFRTMKRIQYKSNDLKVRRQAAADAEYFKAKAQRQKK
jgi:hypothetical protein